MAHADQTRQTHCAAIDQRHTPPPAVHAEHRIARRYPQVAPQRQLQPTGDGVALHGGDHRLRQQHPRRPHGPVVIHLHRHPIAARRGGDSLQVGAGAEGAARTGQHTNRERVIRIEPAKGVGQLPSRGAVDGIPHRWPVDGDDGDRTVDVVVHRHGRKPRAPS